MYSPVFEPGYPPLPTPETTPSRKGEWRMKDVRASLALPIKREGEGFFVVDSASCRIVIEHGQAITVPGGLECDGWIRLV